MIKVKEVFILRLNKLTEVSKDHAREIPHHAGGGGKAGVTERRGRAVVAGD